MDIIKNKYIIILLSLCMTLLTSCGSMVGPQQNEELGKAVNPQQNEELGKAVDPQQNEELGKAVNPQQNEELGKEVGTQQNEELGKEVDPQQNVELGKEVNLQQNEELSEWEKLYDQWQGKELETKLSFGKEIYSVSVVRRCGNEDEGIYMTYNFSLYDTDREDVLKLLTKEEHIITNNVLKAELSNRVTFIISDDSGCIKEIGFAAVANEDDPVYFTVSYLFPHKDKGDVSMSFAGELAYEDWKELMEIVNKSIAEKPFDEINILQ